MVLMMACPETQTNLKMDAGSILVPATPTYIPTRLTCRADRTSRISSAPISKYWMRKLLAVKMKPESVASATPRAHENLWKDVCVA